jgi:benzoylsuccinyl-CoA thiolase BbsB subunit
MRTTVVLGVGMVKFGRYPNMPVEELGQRACWAALEDARVEWKDIPVAFCGHAFQGNTMGQRIMNRMGMTGIPIMNVENACASGSTAFIAAYQSVASGMYDIALALGVEKMSFKGMIDSTRQDDIERPLGMGAMPTKYALIARRYMEDYGLTAPELAQVSVKNHKNGCLNPYSQYQQMMTVEEVLKSRMICEPLTLYQCSPTGDGAAAAVLCTEAVARRFSTGPFVRVAGCAVGSQVFVEGEPNDISEITSHTARRAYEMWGSGPEEVDVVELHDCFTIAEISHYEGLGLCRKGEGKRFLISGATEIGGKIPVNPSGGLLSRGHPVGATGLAQIAEITWQLRGQAGEHQVKGAKAGLTHTLGGGGGMACAVTILTR